MPMVHSVMCGFAQTSEFLHHFEKAFMRAFVVTSADQMSVLVFKHAHFETFGKNTLHLLFGDHSMLIFVMCLLPNTSVYVHHVNMHVSFMLTTT